MYIPRYVLIFFTWVLLPNKCIIHMSIIAKTLTCLSDWSLVLQDLRPRKCGRLLGSVHAGEKPLRAVGRGNMGEPKKIPIENPEKIPYPKICYTP